jgi:hypothetical protein
VSGNSGPWKNVAGDGFDQGFAVLRLVEFGGFHSEWN